VVTVGPATFTRWSGLYFGGDVSYNNATTDFGQATAPGVEFALQGTVVQQQFTPSELQLLGKGADSAFGGGAFVGYNTQWQDLRYRRLSIAFVSEFPPDCRGCVRTLCTPTCTQNGCKSDRCVWCSALG
jgi:hypothetical protein